MNDEAVTGRQSGFNRQKPAGREIQPDLTVNRSEIEEILAALALTGSVQKVRSASLWALKLALLASREEGLGGEIRILIPPKSTIPIEASFTTRIAS